MMTEKLTPSLLRALRGMKQDNRAIFDIYRIENLVTGGYAHYTVFAGWIISDIGNEYLAEHTNGN